MVGRRRQRCSGSRGRTVDLRARIGSRGRRLQPEQVDAEGHGADDVGTGEHGAKGQHHPH